MAAEANAAAAAAAACTHFFSFLCTNKGLTIATLVVGLVCIFVRPLRLHFSKAGPCWRRDKAATDFFNGLSLVPFIAMPASILDAGLMTAVQSNELVLASAGVVGLIFVVSEIIKIDPTPAKRGRPKADKSQPAANDSAAKKESAASGR